MIEILVYFIRNYQRIYYFLDDLIKCSEIALPKNWPSCSDPSFDNLSGKQDHERWYMDNQNDRVPPIEDSRPKRDRADDGLVSRSKRKSTDPEERINEEKYDVLSPQMKSFQTTCRDILKSFFSRLFTNNRYNCNDRRSSPPPKIRKIDTNEDVTIYPQESSVLNSLPSLTASPPPSKGEICDLDNSPLSELDKKQLRGEVLLLSLDSHINYIPGNYEAGLTNATSTNEVVVTLMDQIRFLKQLLKHKNTAECNVASHGHRNFFC